MKSLNIKTKLRILLILPILGLLFFSGLESVKGLGQINSLDSLNKGAILSIDISKLVHETQKERGMTAGYLGSKGSKFSSEIVEQRKLTDKWERELKKFLRDNDFSVIDDHIYDELQGALRDLESLSSIRSRVDSLNISLKEALAYYTNMNAKLLTAVDLMAGISKSKKVTQELIAYANFLQAKERAGIERAVGANTLAKGKFTPANRTKFIKLIAFQEAYLINFKHAVTPESMSFYKQTMQGSDIDEVNRIREILLNKDENFGVDSVFWFSKITAKINKLKQIDDHLAQELIESIEKEQMGEEMYVYTLIAISLIMSILVIVMSVFILRDISFKLDSLNEALLTLISTNDPKNRIEVAHEDEIGEISNNFNKYGL